MAGVLELEKLIVRIVADAAGYNAPMDGAVRKLDVLSQAAIRTGKILTASVTAPLAAVGGMAVKAASDFESSFTGVRKTVKATDTEFKQLSEGFKEMARTIPVNVNQLNNIGAAAGQLGIQKENILKFTRVIADMGVATNLVGDEGATTLARFANITQMGQDKFSNLGSTIVALGNNFATTEAEIAAMGLRIAGAGSQIGLSESQILGLATGLSALGIEAEMGGSSISRVMIEIAKQVSSGGENLHMLATISGQTTAQFAENFKKNAGETVVEFIEGLGRMSAAGEDVFSTLDSLGFDAIRVGDALLRASGAGDKMREAMTLASHAWQENNALSTEAAERYKTFASQVIIFKNNLWQMAMDIGDLIIPTLKQLIEQSKTWFEWWRNLDDGTKKLIVSLAGIAAAVGPALITIGFLGQGISALAAAYAFLAPKIAADIMSLQLWTARVGAAGVAAVALKAAVIGLAIAGFAVLAKWLFDAAANTRKLNEEMERAIDLRNKLSAMGNRQTSQTLERAANISDPGQRRQFLQAELDRAQKVMLGANVGLEAAKKRADELRDSLRLTPGKGSTALTEWITGVGKEIESITGDARQRFDDSTASVQMLRDELNRLPAAAGGAATGGAASGGVQKTLQTNALTKSVTTLTDRMKDQIATFGMNERQLEIWKLKTAGVKDEQLALAHSLDQVITAQERSAELTKEVNDLTDSLRVQAATFHMGSREAQLWALNMRGVGVEQLRMAQALDKTLTSMEKQRELLEKGKELTKQYQTPLEKFRETQRTLNELLKANAISMQTFTRAIMDARAELLKTKNAMTDRPSGLDFGSGAWMDFLNKQTGAFSRQLPVQGNRGFADQDREFKQKLEIAAANSLPQNTAEKHQTTLETLLREIANNTRPQGQNRNPNSPNPAPANLGRGRGF